MKSLPWLRLYTEIIDDEKLGLLAFEDRWHFIALLCLKGKGVLDNESDAEMLRRKVALKMGLTCAELEKVASRLSRMGLIDFDTFQPCAWDMRQMPSDTDPTNAQRQHRHRMKNKGITPDNALRNASVTRIDTDTDIDIEKEEEGKKKPAQAQATTLDIAASLLSDWETVRKAKKAGPLTATAIAGLTREAAKAGLTITEAVTACVEAGWQGFRADWYAKRTEVNPAAAMTAGNRSESFAMQDQRAKRKAWEEMTGEKWPDDEPSAKPIEMVVDISNAPKRLA